MKQLTADKRCVAVVVAFMAFYASPSLAQAADSPLPDVYLVTIDTLRADHVHCYGDAHIETPALDAIAREGIRFASAFTPSPLTNTAHASILTGLLPSVHGVTDFGIPLAPTIPTWAELLKQDGYTTAAFIGAVVLDSHTLAPGLDRGFDYYDNFPQGPAGGKHWGRVERRGADVEHRAQTWMDTHPSKPRFVWMHLYDPHDPYEPPPPFAQKYKDHLYDGEIAYADSALGQLLEYLKRQKRYNHALIIVTGDHGEGLGEHGEQTHGIFLYDATTHVPLLIKLPASRSTTPVPGTVVQDQVETTDILPTVLDLLQISPPPSLANRSLRPDFSSASEKDRVVYGETDYPFRFGWAPLRAVRSGGYKFIEAPRPEFYDLAKDPGELSNVYEPWNKTVQDLRSALIASAMKTPRVSSATGAAGGKTLDELRALGYLGPADAQTSTNVPELSSLPDPKDKIEEQNLLHTAMMLADEGHTPEARGMLKKLVTMDPASAIGFRQLGELDFKAGEYREAAECFAHVLTANPGDTPAAVYEAKALSKQGDPAGARKLLESAVTQAPSQLDSRLLLASMDARLGDRAAAEDQFDAVLLLDAQQPEALRGLAEEQLKEKQYSEVVALLKPQISNGNVELTQLLIQAYEGLGQTAEANQLRNKLRNRIPSTDNKPRSK